MHDELQVLKTVSERFEALHLPFMLTGSFAARRFYAGELPEAALIAHAEWSPDSDPNAA